MESFSQPVWPELDLKFPWSGFFSEALKCKKKKKKIENGFRIFTQNHHQELQNEPLLLASLCFTELTLHHLQNPFRASLWIWLDQIATSGVKFHWKKACTFSFLEFLLDNLQKMWGGFPIDSSYGFHNKIVDSPQFWVRIESAKLRCKNQTKNKNNAM